MGSEIHHATETRYPGVSNALSSFKFWPLKVQIRHHLPISGSHVDSTTDHVNCRHDSGIRTLQAICDFNGSTFVTDNRMVRSRSVGG